MAVQLKDVTRRLGVSVVGIAAAAALVAGCSSSGGGTPSGGNNSSSSGGGGTTATNTTPATGGGSTSTGSTGGGTLLNPFCTGFKSSDLAALGNTSTANDAVKAWDQFAKDAPSEIKANVQEIDKYLHDYVDHNYTDLQTMAANIGKDAQAIGTYYAAHCHA